MAKYLFNQEAVANLKLGDTAILERLVDFESAREAHSQKAHAKKDKRMTLGEAVATFVQDGDIITDSGFAYVRTPQQAFYEVIRQGKKNLQMIGAPNTNQSFFIFYGCVSYSHNSYTGAEMRGIDRIFDRALKAKKTTILSEWSHGGIAQGFKAAQLGSPGILSKQMLGSDLVRYNPYLKVIQHPLKENKEAVVFVPALYPDVSFIHCHAADKYGNAYIYGPAINDLAIATAARKVIITAEEIVPENNIRYNKQGQIIPFFYADAVVEMPFGALPGSMPGCYYWPRQWWEKCMRFACASEENAKAFLDEWIMGVKDQFEFVEKLGGAKWIAEARRQTKAAEGDNEDIDFSYEEYTLKHDSGLFY
ncbi:MAG: hypothetical protein K9K75_00890 [Deltaproteobacteria bacterium]|nr:hypothetical protein [Deltaproteobacteria bacterium]